MFDLSKFSAEVRAAFREAPAFWPITVDAAIKSGVRDPDKLADLIFFMHHPERMTGNKGRALKTSEANFDALVEEWQAFRSIVMPILLPKVPEVSAGAKDWDLNGAQRHSLHGLGGKALVEWAALPPSAPAETMAFASQKPDIKRILAWKSQDPKSLCLASPQKRIQLFLMPPDSLDYWKKRMPDGNMAEIKSTAIRGSNRAYRKHIIENKLCPKAAFNLEVAESRSLILKMAAELFAMMPIPGVKGEAQFDSLKKLVEAMASAFQGAD